MKINESISCMRVLSCEMINRAKSGHPGIALGAAPLAYAIFKNHMHLNVKFPKWYNRDRFVLSAGHGSALLYSLLHLVGYDLPMSELKAFRQANSITPGHPESTMTPGVEAVTGPLGQGVGVLVGMALAESIKAARFNTEDFKIVDNYTFGITSDGDLEEGVSYEAISLAGHWKLNKLILLYDSNDVQLDSEVNKTQTEDVKKRFEAAHWNYILVKKGNDENAINEAINEAKKCKDKPTLIEVKTIIGHGAPKCGTTAVHGAPLMDGINELKKNLEWNYDEEFFIPESVKKDFATIQAKGEAAYDEWNKQLEQYAKKYPDKYAEYISEIKNNFNLSEKDFKNLMVTSPQATRVSSGIIMDSLTPKYKSLIGGSGDLSSSTKIRGADGAYQYDNRKGRNILYGVREFSMITINNGIASYGGTLPFASGFLVFSDYIKPGIRLSSMMQLQQLYIFTHDSFLVGEDGPTHQPIEHLAMFRAQPNLNVFRPADFKETLGAYIYALNKSLKTPSVFSMTRQNVPQLVNSSVAKVAKGAYVIHNDPKSKATIIATGSEVDLALRIKDQLANQKISINVVSMPCQELFDKQNAKYKEEVLPKNHKRISLEFQSIFGWGKYVGFDGLSIGIDEFGSSGKADEVIKTLKFDCESLTKRIFDFLIKKD